MVRLTILISIFHFDLVQLSSGLCLTKLNIALIQHNLGNGFCLSYVIIDNYLNITLFKHNPRSRLCLIYVLFNFNRLG